MASQLYSSTGRGSLWPGAIIGDLPNPSGCAVLGAGQYYTTGDVDQGGDGEVGGQTAFTLECWIKTDAIPAGNENFASGPMTVTGIATREWVLTLNSTGTVSISARSAVPATVTATSSGVIVPGFWYHMVGRLDGTNLKVFLNGIEVGTTAFASSVENRGTTPGVMDTVLGCPTGSVTYSIDEFAIYRASLGTDRILAHYQAGVQRGFAVMKPGAHVTQALDAVSSRASRRINLGSRLMWASFYAGSSALDELQSARLAESVDATAFTSKSGEVVFLDAAHRSSAPYNTVQMTLGDAGGTEVAYEDLALDYSEDTLANEWNVTGITAGAEGLTQTASDATSISRYFRRPQSITGVPVGDSDCAAIATAMLAKYKDPILRGTSVSLDAGDPDVADQAFQRDLADRTRVLRTPPGGGARLDQTLFIQQIEISGSNDGKPWDVTWGLSPL